LFHFGPFIGWRIALGELAACDEGSKVALSVRTQQRAQFLGLAVVRKADCSRPLVTAQMPVHAFA
jgi:hypothetical protein